MHDPVHVGEEGVLLEVWLVPRSSRPGPAGLHGGRLKLRVSSPPEGGRANREAVMLLAGLLDTRVILEKGMTSRAKTFRIAELDGTAVRRKLGLDR